MSLIKFQIFQTKVKAVYTKLFIRFLLLTKFMPRNSMNLESL